MEFHNATKSRVGMHGVVKWFNYKKGYGFITDDTGKDIFVHYSGIAGHGFKVLNDGEEVIYDLDANDKGAVAVNVRVIKNE